MPTWLKDFLTIVLKNAVNAVLTNAGLMTMLSGDFNIHSANGWWNIGKATLSVIVAREAVVWVPVLLKWSSTNATPPTIVLLLVCTLALTGCPKVEQDAYRTVVGAKAFLDSVKQSHPECSVATNTATLCVDLRKATSAKDLIIDAGEVYCNVAVFGNDDKTPCMPLPKNTPAGQKAFVTLQNTMANYNQVEKDLKGVLN